MRFGSPSSSGTEGSVDPTLNLMLISIPPGGIEEEIVVTLGLGTIDIGKAGMLDKFS